MSRPAAATPIALGELTLRNRIVGTAHASGAVRDGLPIAGDAEYWRRAAAGGAGMLVVGGTLVSPHSAPRSGTITEAWKPEVVPGLMARAAAIRAEGAVSGVPARSSRQRDAGCRDLAAPRGPVGDQVAA